MSLNDQKEEEKAGDSKITTDEMPDCLGENDTKDIKEEEGINKEDKGKENTFEGNSVKVMNSGTQDVTTDKQNKVINSKGEKDETATGEKKERIESKEEKIVEVRKSERI